MVSPRLHSHPSTEDVYWLTNGLPNWKYLFGELVDWALQHVDVLTYIRGMNPNRVLLSQFSQI